MGLSEVESSASSNAVCLSTPRPVLVPLAEGQRLHAGRLGAKGFNMMEHGILGIRKETGQRISKSRIFATGKQ